MGDISRYISRLRALGFCAASANHIVAKHLSSGTLDELAAMIEKMESDDE